MKVLVITGDKNFKTGHERYELQRSVVDALEVAYWGRGSLWPAIPKGQFDVVTAQDPFWRGLFAWYAAKRLGAKLNVQVHTDLSVYGGIKRMLMQIVLRRADSVRAVSSNIKLQVERLGVRTKISVLPVFVDISRFQAIVREPHVGKTILWIGRFETEKNPLQAIAVLQEALRQVPGVRLVMLGAGSLDARIKEAAARLPVELPGWQDPVSYLGAADVVLCTSLHESWGASIVEALAAGVPVVAPDVGVAREAGAIVAGNEALAGEVITVLKSGARGQLQLDLPNKELWAHQWKEAL